MKCNMSKEQLMGYLYQEMAPSELDAFEAHLSQCSGCKKELQRLKQTSRLLSLWPDEESNMNVIFTQGGPGTGESWLTKWPVRAGWPRFAFGLAAAFSVLLVLLSLVNFEATYESGNFRVQLSLLPRRHGTPVAFEDSLATPVTRGQFNAWRKQSLQLMQEVVQDSELRQRRQLQLALKEYDQKMDMQRLRDLQLVGKGLEVFQSSNESRFRQTDQILEHLITVANFQGARPDNR
ncbi:MAG: zf-HC2 domain-containing protein [bacterium]